MEALVYALGAFGLMVLVLATFVIISFKRLRALNKGKSAASLESIIQENNALIKKLSLEHAALAAQVSQLEDDARHHIQHVKVIRYNPFKEVGGNQSFAIALTDKTNTGLVLSSLFARDRVNIFAKPVSNGSSEFILSEEEKEALTQSSH